VSPSEFSKIGKRLYGEDWKEPLAKELGVRVRSIDRWLSGQHSINERTAKLVRLLAENREE
jgi:hypothetical protein